jgi:hypothetical protein
LALIAARQQEDQDDPADQDDDSDDEHEQHKNIDQKTEAGSTAIYTMIATPHGKT